MNKLTIYYFIIAAILIGKTASTLYQRSVVVHHGHSVVSLQKQKQELAEKQLTLAARLADITSLSAVENSGITSQFQPIASPVVITNARLAASQL